MSNSPADFIARLQTLDREHTFFSVGTIEGVDPLACRYTPTKVKRREDRVHLELNMDDVYEKWIEELEKAEQLCVLIVQERGHAYANPNGMQAIKAAVLHMRKITIN